MSKALWRRLAYLETASNGPDLSQYEGLPFNEWPDWALLAYLGNPTDEQLAAMIGELQVLTDADMSMAGSSQS